MRDALLRHMGRFIGLTGCLGFAALLFAPAAHAECAVNRGGFVADLSRVLYQADETWWAGRPLSDARNAHRTNTREQFDAALDGGYNWFEGDVRAEINHPDRLEMRHDENHESGDNLTLREWLERGKRSGRGLKLDVKETALMDQLLDTIEDVGVPEERLMLNLGDAGMAEWGDEIRRRFPNATLAINPRKRDGRIDVDRMIELAERFGGPVTFVLHEGDVTREVLDRLQRHAPVSVWGTVDDPEARAEELRDLGAEGMVDIGHAGGVDPFDWAKNTARTWFDRAF